MAIIIDDVTNITDTTTGAGTGIFDELMTAINTHLNIQFTLNRITGLDYATVYLGAIQAASQQAIQYVQIKAANDIAEAQSTQELALKQAQQDLTEQQALLVQQQILNAVIEGTLLTAQKLKTDAETALMTQKGITEWASTELLAKAGTVDGLVGTQISLYQAQANGFKHKAAYDAVKVLADMWNVAITQDTTLPDLASTGTAKYLLSMIMDLYKQADVDDPQFTKADGFAGTAPDPV